MAKERSLVRASDIGSYAFCRRAWFLTQVKGVAHGDPARLAAGVVAHAEHGGRVRRSGRTAWAGRLLLVAGVLLALAAFILWWLS